MGGGRASEAGRARVGNAAMIPGESPEPIIQNHRTCERQKVFFKTSCRFFAAHDSCSASGFRIMKEELISKRRPRAAARVRQARQHGAAAVSGQIDKRLLTVDNPDVTIDKLAATTDKTSMPADKTGITTEKTPAAVEPSIRNNFSVLIILTY